MQLLESERQTLIHCLNVAAMQFDRDADTLAHAEIAADARTVKTFRDQAVTARLWADTIENAESVVIK